LKRKGKSRKTKAGAKNERAEGELESKLLFFFAFFFFSMVFFFFVFFSFLLEKKKISQQST